MYVPFSSVMDTIVQLSLFKHFHIQLTQLHQRSSLHLISCGHVTAPQQSANGIAPFCAWPGNLGTRRAQWWATRSTYGARWRAALSSTLWCSGPTQRYGFPPPTAEFTALMTPSLSPPRPWPPTSLTSYVQYASASSSSSSWDPAPPDCWSPSLCLSLYEALCVCRFMKPILVSVALWSPSLCLSLYEAHPCVCRFRKSILVSVALWSPSLCLSLYEAHPCVCRFRKSILVSVALWSPSLCLSLYEAHPCVCRLGSPSLCLSL